MHPDRSSMWNWRDIEPTWLIRFMTKDWKAIGGKGIASALVKAAYDYGRCKGLKAIATCSYAVVWLQRHPEYQGEVSSDYIGKGSCAL